MTLLSVFLVLFISCVQSTKVKDIKIGLVGTKDQLLGKMAYLTSASATSLALEKATDDGIIRQAHYNISFLYEDDHLTDLGGAGAASSLVLNGAHVIIGSPHTEANYPIGLLTASWNLPHITWFDDLRKVEHLELMNNKSVFSTLVNMHPPIERAVDALRVMLKMLNWERIGIVYTETDDTDGNQCAVVADILGQKLTDINIQIKIRMAASNLTTVGGYLDKISRSCRILLMCTTPDAERKLLLQAHERNMTKGEYVFISVNPCVCQYSLPWYRGDTYDEVAKQAFMSYFQFRDFYGVGDLQFKRFKQEVPRRMALPPWENDYALANNLQASLYAPYLHDAVYMYLLAVNMSAGRNKSYTQGKDMFAVMKTLSFEGISGHVELDKDGNRLSEFAAIGVNEDGSRNPAIKVHSNNTVTNLSTKLWYLNENKLPPDIPPCGFNMEFCTKRSAVNAMILGYVAVVVALCSLLALVTMRRQKERTALVNRTWFLTKQDVSLVKTDVDTLLHRLSLFSCTQLQDDSHRRVYYDRDPDSSLVFYNDRFYFMHILRDCPDVSIMVQSRCKVLQQIEHQNINLFLGVYVDAQATMGLVFAYCARGSLQDVLQSTAMDWPLYHALIKDIVTGMQYLHDTVGISHGKLKPTNCLIDDRWMIKITDYGPSELRDSRRNTRTYDVTEWLWTAPEILRLPPADRPSAGTHKGDLYSFGIMIHQMIFRSLPYSGVVAEEIVRRVINVEPVPFRPVITDRAMITSQTDTTFRRIVKIMKQCWAEQPEKRGTFLIMQKAVIEITIEGKSFFDDVTLRIGSYNEVLEKLVEEKKEQIAVERQKTEALLYQLMPRYVVDIMSEGKPIEPEFFDSLTVFFAEVYDFLNILVSVTSLQFVKFMNDLFSRLDSVLDNYDVFKMEFTNQCYMVVAGLEDRENCANMEHAAIVANLALDMKSTVEQIALPIECDEISDHVRLKMGFHTGPCCAGIVGKVMPNYCLLGDTVNTASRMASHGKESLIHMSKSAKEALDKVRPNTFLIESRGLQEIKGKGTMETFWLQGYDPSLGPIRRSRTRPPSTVRQNWEQLSEAPLPQVAKSDNLYGITLASPKLSPTLQITN